MIVTTGAMNNNAIITSINKPEGTIEATNRPKLFKSSIDPENSGSNTFDRTVMLLIAQLGSGWSIVSLQQE